MPRARRGRSKANKEPKKPPMWNQAYKQLREDQKASAKAREAASASATSDPAAESESSHATTSQERGVLEHGPADGSNPSAGSQHLHMQAQQASSNVSAVQPTPARTPDVSMPNEPGHAAGGSTTPSAAPSEPPGLGADPSRQDQNQGPPVPVQSDPVLVREDPKTGGGESEKSVPADGGAMGGQSDDNGAVPRVFRLWFQLDL